MKLVGLTGGIGSGKSTVAALLAAHGAVVIDADAAVRSVQQPGSPVLQAMADRFGPQVIAADGSLDRAAVAAIAFADPQALHDLNGIVHPAVRAEMNRLVDQQRETDRIVILDIPLLTENPRPGLQGIIVVDVPEDLQLARLVRFRGFTPADALARISKQASRADRLATASMVVDNSGDLESLGTHVAVVWAWLQSLPQRDRHADSAKPLQG